MNAATVEARRALMASARRNVAKILAPDTTRIGASILAKDALKDLDAAIAIDENARKAGRPAGRGQ